MAREEQDRLKRVLQSALPPVEDATLQHDLWPEMLRKMERESTQVHWLDWALAGLLAGWIFFFPSGILHLLYHL
jgi:hypothetical protein